MYGDDALMAIAVLTPDQLDGQASRLHDTQAWQQIVTGWDHTVPEPAPSPAEPTSARPAEPSGRPSAGHSDWRSLLSVPVDRLVDDTLRTLPAAPPHERPLPGRLGAMLPDRVHLWRRVGQGDLRPSTHLGYARQILAEWGWQNTPYRLRNVRGARCVCGALISAHRLGYGSLDTVDRVRRLADHGAARAGVARADRPLEPPSRPHGRGRLGPLRRHHPPRVPGGTVTVDH